MTTVRWIADWAVRSSALIVAGDLMLRAVRVKAASVRLAAWVALLFASLTIPALTAFLPGLPLMPARLAAAIPGLTVEAPPAGVTAPMATPTARNGGFPAESSRQASMASTHPAITQPAPAFDWMEFGVAIYSCVAGFLLLRAILGLLLGQRLLRRSPRTGRMWQGIEIRQSESLSVPVTLGIARPAIVLPAEWREWDDDKLQGVIAHEAAHVRRRDPLVQAVSALHRALLWLTPLSWYLHRQIVRVAEEASDDAAVTTVRDPAQYAGILLEFMRGDHRRASWEGVAMARYGNAEKRIRRILDGTAVTRGVTGATVVLIVLLAFPLTYVAAAAREAAPEALNVPVRFAATLPVVPASSETIASPAAPARTAKSGTAREEARGQEVQSTNTVQQAKQAAADAQPPIRRYVIVQDRNTMSGSWDSDSMNADDLRTRFGDRFAWFRQNGREYLITDAGILDEFDKAMEPQKNVNRMQSEVNAQQSRVNEMQSKVNTHQNGVNGLQRITNKRQNLVNQIQNAVNHQDNATLAQKTEELRQMVANQPEASQEAVNRMQSDVNQEQSEVNAEQSKVNEMQHKVNDEQHRVNLEFNKKMQEIFASALQKSLAKEVK